MSENVFDGFISKLSLAEETISELEDMTGETTKTEKQRKENGQANQNMISKICGTTTKGLTHA